MASHAIAAKATRTALPSVWRFGFWTALSLSVLSVVTFAIAFATLPRSGPFCTISSCVIAPYINVAGFFPIELAVILIGWLVLNISAILVSIVFNRAVRDEKS
jgi:hypothetical protein